MRLISKLAADELGAVLTTELLLVSTLTVAGILTVATDVRDGLRDQADRLIRAISSLELPGGLEPAPVPVPVRVPEHCVLIHVPADREAL